MTYEKKGKELEVARNFIYSEEVFLNYPGRWELFRSQKYSSKVPVFRKKCSQVYSESHGCFIKRYWELIAAPEQYLIEQGFKPKL